MTIVRKTVVAAALAAAFAMASGAGPAQASSFHGDGQLVHKAHSSFKKNRFKFVRKGHKVYKCGYWGGDWVCKFSHYRGHKKKIIIGKKFGKKHGKHFGVYFY